MCSKCRLLKRIENKTIDIHSVVVSTPAAYKMWADLLIKHNNKIEGSFGEAVGESVAEMSIEELLRFTVAAAVVRQSMELLEAGVMMQLAIAADETYGVSDENVH